MGCQVITVWYNWLERYARNCVALKFKHCSVPFSGDKKYPREIVNLGPYVLAHSAIPRGRE